jgi:hypothetical protein
LNDASSDAMGIACASGQIASGSLNREDGHAGETPARCQGQDHDAQPGHDRSAMRSLLQTLANETEFVYRNRFSASKLYLIETV